MLTSIQLQTLLRQETDSDAILYVEGPGGQVMGELQGFDLTEEGDVILKITASDFEGDDI